MQKPGYIPQIVIPEFESPPDENFRRQIVSNDLPNALASGFSKNVILQGYINAGVGVQRAWFLSEANRIQAQARDNPYPLDLASNKPLGDVGRQFNDYSFKSRYREIVEMTVYNKVTGEIENRGHVIYHTYPMTPQEILDEAFAFYNEDDSAEAYQLTVLSGHYAEAFINVKNM